MEDLRPVSSHAYYLRMGQRNTETSTAAQRRDASWTSVSKAALIAVRTVVRDAAEKLTDEGLKRRLHETADYVEAVIDQAPSA